jgi:histidinol phosphatase-like PHP family hydrolase
MKILNTEKEDYHVHSFNFSDGMPTIEEIVQFAGKIRLRKLVITDHSQATLDKYGYVKKNSRNLIKRWKNVHNRVDVSFGVEADLLNDKGDCCFHIQGIEGEFIILSYHKEVYSGDRKRAAEGMVRAIRRYHDRIDMIGHPGLDMTGEDAKAVISEANRYNIPLELDANYFLTDPEKWTILLKNAVQIYINSDAHTLWELKTRRKEARALLKKMGCLKR